MPAATAEAAREGPLGSTPSDLLKEPSWEVPDALPGHEAGEEGAGSSMKPPQAAQQPTDQQQPVPSAHLPTRCGSHAPAWAGPQPKALPNDGVRLPVSLPGGSCMLDALPSISQHVCQACLQGPLSAFKPHQLPRPWSALPHVTMLLMHCHNRHAHVSSGRIQGDSAGLRRTSGTRSGRMFLSTSRNHTRRPPSSQPLVCARPAEFATF